jgi:hypothetical protein
VSSTRRRPAQLEQVRQLIRSFRRVAIGERHVEDPGGWDPTSIFDAAKQRLRRSSASLPGE